MIKIIFNCDKCGCTECKIVLCDGIVSAVCCNEDCMNHENIDYIRWD